MAALISQESSVCLIVWLESITVHDRGEKLLSFVENSMV